MPNYENSGGKGVKAVDGFIGFGGTTQGYPRYKWTRQGGVLQMPVPNVDLYESYLAQGIDVGNPANLYQIDDINFFGAFIQLGVAPFDHRSLINVYPILWVGVYYIGADGLPHSVNDAFVQIYPVRQGTQKEGGIETILPTNSDYCYITFTSLPSVYVPSSSERNPNCLAFISSIAGYIGDEQGLFNPTLVHLTPYELVGKEFPVDSDYFRCQEFLIALDNTGSIGSADLEEGEENQPYPSGGGGGGGSYSGSSDPVDFTPLPTTGAVGSGFVHLYNPNQGDLSAFGGYLWSKDLFDNISKLFQDPMDLIVTLNVVPCPVAVSGYADVKIGSLNSNVPMPTVASEFTQILCGSVFVDEYYGSALDYAPATKVSLFLPYVGVVSLNADEVINSYISIAYNCNLLTGGAVAQVKVTKNANNGVNSVLYHYPCNIAYPIEISGKNYANIIKSAENSIIGAGMTAGASGSVIGGIAGGITSGLNTMTSKPQTSRSGSFSGSSGYMDSKVPYVIIERPIQSYADRFNHFEGLPSNITSKIKNLTGFTQFESVEMKGLTCHEDEKKEIEELLLKGIYI